MSSFCNYGMHKLDIRPSKESGRTASGVIEISSRQTAQNHKNVIYMEAYGGCNV